MTSTAADAQPVGAGPWLTPDEAAAYARVSVATIYRASAAGALSGAKITRGKAKSRWRFKASDVDAWLEGQRPSNRTAAAARRRSPASYPR